MRKQIVVTVVGVLLLLSVAGIGASWGAIAPAAAQEPPEKDVHIAMGVGYSSDLAMIEEDDWVDWYAVAAEVLGMDEDALWQALDENKSLAEIAQARDVDPQQIMDAIVAAEMAWLEEDVRQFVEESCEAYEGVDWYAVAAEALGMDMESLWQVQEEGQSLAEIAQANDVDPQQIIDAIVAAENASIDQMVADGELDQEEADEWKAELVEMVSQFVEESWMAYEGVDWYAVAVEALGMDEEALWQAQEEGKSLAEIAQANDVDPQQIIDAIVAAENASIDQMVADGELGQEEADEWKSELVEMVSQFVEESWEAYEGVDWFAVAAEALGIDDDALWDAMDDGQSLAEIAQASDVDPQQIIDAIVAAENAWIDQMVADGELDQAEADEWKAELAEEVRQFVEEGLSIFFEDGDVMMDGFDVDVGIADG